MKRLISQIAWGLLGSLFGIGASILSLIVQDNPYFRDLWPRTVWEFGRTDPFAAILLVWFLAPMLGFALALKTVADRDKHRHIFQRPLGFQLLLAVIAPVCGAALGSVIGESIGITLFGLLDGAAAFSFWLQMIGFVAGAWLTHCLATGAFWKRAETPRSRQTS